MKYGVCFSQMLGHTPTHQDILAFAKEAEALGYNSIVAGEHVIMPSAFDDSVYPAGVFEASSHWYDVLGVLAAIAGATSTIRLQTGVAVVAYQPPIQRAAAIATLDYMSGGRFVFGAGVGWMREEFDALGVSFDKRGPLSDEYLSVMKLLWSGNPEPFHGEFVSFEGGRISPLPIQKPHPPILIGGETAPALRRVARHGDGFYINWKTLSEFEALLSQLEGYLMEAGRTLADVYKQLATTELSYIQAAKDDLPQYEALGLEEIIYSPKCDTPEEGFAAMRGFAREFF